MCVVCKLDVESKTKTYFMFGKDDDAENIFEDTVNSVIKENPGHLSDAKISGDATDS